MVRHTVTSLALGLVALLSFPLTASAQQPATPAVDEAATEAQLTPAVDQKGINGVLLALDGKTPLAGRTLTLTNLQTSDRIAVVVTAEDGSFHLPELVNGDYCLQWDGRVQYFQIRADRPLRTLKILAGERREGLAQLQDGGNTLLYVGVGTGVAIIGGVGAGVAVHNFTETTGDDLIAGAGGNLEFESSPTGAYGPVQIGQTASRTFRLRNRTSARLIGSLSLASTQFDVSGSSNFDLEPGESANVVVTFTPTVLGGHQAVLTANATAAIPDIITSQGIGTRASKSLSGAGAAVATSPSQP